MFIIITEHNGWHTQQLSNSLNKHNKKYLLVKVNRISFSIDTSTHIHVNDSILNIKDIEGIFVRGIPGGTFEEVIYYLNVLHFFELNNITVYNSATSIEKCVDKARTSLILSQSKINCPKTYMTSNIKSFNDFVKNSSNKLVSKPIFGSQGKNLEIIDSNNSHPDYTNLNGVYYTQDFIKNKSDKYEDWRIFVVNNAVVAAMRREGSSWINNVAQGADCYLIEANKKMADLAIRASESINVNYAGVDIIEDKNGEYLVTEINSIPAWQGLQSVNKETIISDVIVDNFLKICGEENNTSQ